MNQETVIDTKYRLKTVIRGLIFENNNVLKKNLNEDLQILHSTQYPTQVFKLHNKKYMRFNAKDIETLNDNEFEDLVKLMLAIDEFAQYTDKPVDMINVIEQACDNYLNTTGENLKESELISIDEFNNIIDTSKIPLVPKMFYKKDSASNKNDENIDVSKDICLSSDMNELLAVLGDIQNNDNTKQKQQENKKDLKELQEIEQLLDEVKTLPNDTWFQQSSSCLNKQEILKLNKIANKLLKAFKGIKSKEKQLTPNKKISAKDLSTDISDKIYISDKVPKGKHIKLNLLIDMSGSMQGNPIKNAVSLIYIFNKLAKQGYVTGNILYSATRKFYVLPIPALDAKILSLWKTSSSEGLTRTVEANKEILKNTNLICITDGDLVDEPINKTFWSKHHIISTGVYIEPNVKNVLEYSGKLNKWFNKSLIRHNIEDMVQLLIKLGIQG